MFKKREYFVLDSNELDNLIKDKLRKYTINEKLNNYESVAYEEWNNYSCYDYPDITKKEVEEDCLYLKHEKQKIIEGNLDCVRHLLMFLVELNEIPEGNYLIRVYW